MGAARIAATARVLGALVGASLVLPQAVAGERESARAVEPGEAWSDAETRRLSIELEAAAARSQWGAVELAYEELSGLGDRVLATQHVLGAEAARQRGDIATAIERLGLAVETGGAPTARGTLAALYDSYGPVRLTRLRLGVHFSIAQPPFSPEAQRAIAFAEAQLRDDGTFDGWLPAGDYSVGEHCVVVSSDMPRRTVIAQRKGRKNRCKRRR